MLRLKSIILTTLVLICLPLSAQTYRGKASFYSNSLHGHRMSDGTPYDKDKLTCAHRSLPFGTLLKVTNPKNGKSVKVRVTDRGPHHKRLIIDLSRRAAEELEIIRAGVAEVVIEVLRETTQVE